MVKFIYSLPLDNHREKLFEAIDKNRDVKIFKKTLIGLEDEWNRYREESLTKFAGRMVRRKRHRICNRLKEYKISYSFGNDRKISANYSVDNYFKL